MRVSLEAASILGWHKYTGADGMNFGIDSFGVSCKMDDAYNHFGLTPAQIAPKIEEELKKRTTNVKSH